MSDILNILKNDLSKKREQELLIDEKDRTTDISKATHLKLSDGQVLELNKPTNFIVDDEQVELKAIYYSWINQSLSAAEFVTDSQSKNIKTLTFVQRNDLINWLSGKSTKSSFLKSDDSDKTISSEATIKEDKMDIDDPFLDAILAKERTLIDHNSSLRGFKPVDFSSVGRECEIKIVKVLKKKGADLSKTQPSNSQSKKKRQNPILIISPAASSLITMANVKTFLEDSLLVDSNSTNPQDQQYLSTEGDIKHITHVFPKIGKQTFLVVNNSQKFSKPEYWDRVVGVVTTGQLWQFKNYKWTDPNELFRRVKGYYFYFDKDPIPAVVKDWNVDKIGIDRHRRFKDAQVLNDFWGSLEKYMISKGWSG